MPSDSKQNLHYNNPSYNGSADLSMPGPKKYLTKKQLLLLLLCAAGAVLVVGLAVGLGQPEKECPECPDATPATTTVITTTTTTTTTTTEAPALELRLPDSLLPEHYNLFLRPDIYGSDPNNFKFDGRVEIVLKCERATDVITLHARDLTIDKSSVKVSEGSNTISIKSQSNSTAQEFYFINLDSQLEAGKKYTVYIEFTGPITKDLKGIYYSSYFDANETRYLLTSQLQPVDGRKVFPCMDEPNLKATFNVSLARYKPSGYTCLSNTQIYKTEPDSVAGWEVDHFERTPIMSLYLLAFTISDFQCVSSTTNDTKLVEICSRPNALSQTDFAKLIAAPIQDWFAWYHNISYPLEKNTHLAVPDFAAGAMENWGLIVYRETALLYDPASSTNSQRQRVAVVVSHELAHMWFGNLVTTAWWDDIWLNEGFASYMELLGINSQFPSWDMDTDFVVNDQQYVFTLDALPTSHPVYLEVSDPAEISQMFDTITYSKGAAVIRMMRNFLGEETFRWGISNYLKDRQYGVANHTDLFNFLSKQAEADGKAIDVTEVMNTWILQMGYPVVTFSLDRSTGKISLSQEHYLLDPSVNRTLIPPSKYNYIWQVPITCASNNDNDSVWENPPLKMMTGKTDEILDIPTDVKWIVGNLNSNFYYRVNYDAETWDELKNQLTTNHEKIKLRSRCQIIDDAFTLGRSNIINQTMALEISSYLGNESEYFPWRAFSNDISYMSDMMVVTGQYGSLKDYIQQILQPVYNTSLWEPVDTAPEAQVMSMKRTLFLSLACKYGIEDCLSNAKQRFDEWMKGTEVEVDLRPVVYCQGLALGGQKEWEFLFDRLKLTTNSGAETQNLLRSIGCTNVDWLLRRTMEEAYAEETIRRQDFSTVLASVAGNSAGRQIAWQTFVEHWDDLYERFGVSQFTMANLVDIVTRKMSSQYEYEQVAEFMARTPDQGTGATAFNQALDKIKANIAWRTTNHEAVSKWLTENVVKP